MRSTHAGAAAATAVAAPRPTPGAGSESDAKTGRRSMPTTPSSVSMAVSTSSAANTMATASPRRPDRRADRPWPPIARKSCATISGRTTARRPFVHARMNESRTNRTVSVAGEEVPLMNSPHPRPAATARHSVTTEGKDLSAIDMGDLGRPLSPHSLARALPLRFTQQRGHLTFRRAHSLHIGRLLACPYGDILREGSRILSKALTDNRFAGLTQTSVLVSLD